MQNQFFSLSEARRFVALGLPVFVAQMSQMGMNFVDTAMTGQASTADMAAVAVAGSIWNPLSLLGIGCLLSLPAMSAHLVGGGQRSRTPHLLRQGIWLTLVISAILMTAFYVISWHLQSFGLDEELSRLGGGYLRAMLWGLPGFMLFVNVRSFLEGYARTRPAMIIGILGLALNVPCNYVLIYGKLRRGHRPVLLVHGRLHDLLRAPGCPVPGSASPVPAPAAAAHGPCLRLRGPRP